ncbi:portal protein [Burkholderia gladioli]|uniref:portal protein n=1 Tax=Burkholderia gladioli TaxID=28095 RepID=UPI001640D7D4|nr:portal protein [Burkholderia gladioli]
MSDSRVEDILRDQSGMDGKKSNWNTLWSQIAQVIDPTDDYFNKIELAGGEKRTQHIFDSTAQSAAERAAAAVESEIMPRTQRWHGLTLQDETIKEDPKWKRWLEQVTNIMFSARYAPYANFAGQASQSFFSLVKYGTQCMFIDEVVGRHLRYKAIHLSEIGIAENHVGIVDKVHRCFCLTVRQAIQKFGKENLPDSIARLEDKEPERQFDFIHCVKPNENGDPGAKRMEFVSYYVAKEGRHIVQVGGYRTMPYVVSRLRTSPKEIYGRSPAMTALADVRMLNEMEKTNIRAAHRVVDPPLLLAEDGALQAFSVRPNALNYGGVDENGRARAIPLQTGANLNLSLEMTEAKRKSINDIFWLTLFQILVQNPQMTATEAMLRAQEKGQLLAPVMGGQQSEWGGQQITRELDILSHAGQLPPPPAPLAEVDLDVVYTGPWARAQRAGDGVAIMNTLNAVLPFAQIDQKVLKRFNFDEITTELADINGMPASCLYTDDEMEANDAATASAEQAQAAVEAAPQLSQSVLNLAKANQAASTPAPTVGG